MEWVLVWIPLSVNLWFGALWWIARAYFNFTKKGD